MIKSPPDKVEARPPEKGGGRLSLSNPTAMLSASRAATAGTIQTWEFEQVTELLDFNINYLSLTGTLPRRRSRFYWAQVGAKSCRLSKKT